jgi:Fe-S cluster assembly ATP-binding protein
MQPDAYSLIDAYVLGVVKPGLKTMTELLRIENLHAEVNGKPILKGLSLTINAGEVHAIMGPNGAGKSTLGHVLSGREGYEVTSGSVHFMGQDLLSMDIEERAVAGLFLAFQYPVEIPGVNNAYFLRTAVNAHRKAQGEDELDAVSFMRQARTLMKELKMNEALIKRNVNEGFSGGEKKRNEVLQMRMLQPKVAILDETDSGLDIDALRCVADGVNALRSAERSFVVITHYQRLLDYIVPDFVHVLSEGRIVASGDKSMALELEAKGYAWLQEGEGEAKAS